MKYIVIAISLIIGATLQNIFKIKTPQVYWLLGVLTGLIMYGIL